MKYFNITLAILLAILGAFFLLPPPQNSNAACNPPEAGESCCDGIEFDPATQGCCDGVVYDLETQDCCYGVVYDTNTQGCCDGVIYDLATQVCCNDEVFDGQCCTNVTTTCIDSGTITGSVENASGYVCWDPDGAVTLYASVYGYDLCGTQEVVTINADCSETTTTNPVCDEVSYRWEITGPDYTNGVGPDAEISTTNCGIYTATFYLDVDRECPPSTFTLSTNLYLVKPDIKVDKYIGIDLSPFPKGTNSCGGSVEVCPPIAESYSWTVVPHGVFNPEPASTDSSVTVEERGTPSSSYLEELLTVTVFPGGCTAETNFTIVEVDISLQGKDEKDEIQKGGNIPSNHDDDNYVDLLYLQDMFEEPVTNENDLVMFTITLTPENLPTEEFVTLTGVEHMYEDDKKLTNAAASYPVDRFPLYLYIDGQEGDKSVKGHAFTAKHDESGAEDTVNYTYIQADVDLPFFGPKTNISNSIDPEIAEYTDDTWGTYLILNDDDDTGNNLKWDFQDETDIKTSADSRIIPLHVDWMPHDPGDDYDAKVTIDWDQPDKVAVYKKLESGALEEITQGAQFDVPITPELELYIEGKEVTDNMKDIEITFSYTRDSVESIDKIKVSVVSVDIDGDSNHDGEITDDDDEVENSDQYPVAVMFNDDDDDDADDVLDNLDNITNGAADLDKMTDIYIREVLPLDIPQGVVTVSGMENVRLFRPESTGDGYVELTNSYDLWNELPITLKAEGVTEGKDTLIVTYEYFGNNDTNGQPFTVFDDKLIVEVFRIDMDIDSDHTENIGGGIERSELEDAIESGGLSSGNQQHLSRKYIVVNDYYDSNSGVPGYADNQTVPGGPVDNGVFVPMKFQTYGCLDETNTIVRFSYTEGSFEEGTEENETIYTPGGNLKLWKKPQGTLRDTNSVVDGGDFIPANTDIPLDKIGSGEIDLYIEGITPSAAGLGTELISVSVANDSSRANGSASAMDEIKCTIIKVDIDIDSNNNNDFDTPTGNLAEDHYEDIENDNSRPGKFMCVNDDDDDIDGIPDFADGYNLDGVNGNDDDTPASTEKFTPVIFKIPEPIVLADALVRLSGDYIDNDPLGVTTNTDGMYILPAGDMRLWLYDESVPRNGSNIVDRGHIITKGEYTAEAFGFTNGVRTITRYLEGIRPSSDVATTRILFEVDPDGVVSGKPYPEFIAADAVRMTIINVDLDINTDDHPKLSGTQIPAVSKATDITDADELKEKNPGGYLWVNDDNDNNTGAADVDLDMNDTANYVDDDLERIKYDISQSVWDAVLKVRIESTFAAGSIKIWKKNKNEELADSTNYTSKSTFDTDTDGILWLEGLKSGSGTLTIKVLNGTTVVCEDKIKATVFAVSEVAWESDGDTTVEADVAPVGNNQKRVFVGKSTSTDSKTRDKPRISVQLTPAIPAGSGWHVPVACFVRDVDHYAHATIEGNMFDENSSSNDQEGHNNGYCPNDNRTGYTGTDDAAGGFGASGDAYNIGVEISAVAGDTVEASQSTATECYWSESIGGTGKGKAILHITHHTPCNNWRVVAGCAGAQACPWTKAKPVRINNLATDGVTMEYIDDSDVMVGSGGGTYSRSTKTLTVWRKLHLEQDYMGFVDFQEPASQNEWSVQDGNVTGGAGTATLATSCNAKYANQWQNGIAQFYKYNLPAKTFLAARNITANTVGPNSSATFGANTSNDVNHVFVTDDDVSAFDDQNATASATAKVSPGVPDTALFNGNGMLHAAAIHMVADTGKDSTDVDFDLNLATFAEETAKIEEKKGIKGSIGYWVSTICVCYQGAPDSSNDPNYPASVAGRGTSRPYWFSGSSSDSMGGCIVFIETIRDWTVNNGGNTDSFNLRNQRTTLHECGHTLGGRHGEGGLMRGGSESPAGTDPNGGDFSGLSLRRFMLLRDEGPSDP